METATVDFQFALNINDNEQGFSPNNGLEFGELGALCRYLNGAINPHDGSKCTLYKVENHGYTPCFVTKSKATYNNFIEVHKNIYERGLQNLNKNEARYANELKRILADTMYIEALDTDKKTVVKITSTEIEKGVESYNVITNKVGVISEIGSQKLDYTSHIYLDGLDYKIYITTEQDAQLRGFYKSSKIDFKIKQRRSIKSGRVISGKLISFFVKSNETLTESLRQLSNDDLSFLNNVNTHEDIIRLIRS